MDRIRRIAFAFATVAGSAWLPAQDVAHSFDLAAAAGRAVTNDNPLGRAAIALDAGANLSLPGAREAPWTDATHFVADVVHTGANSGTLRVEFFAGGERPRIHAKIGLLPGLPTRVAVPLQHLDGQTFFLERRPRQLKGVMPGSRTDPGQISEVRVVFERGEEPDATLWIGGVVLATAPPPAMPASDAPIVDVLGQWRAREWDGKSGSEDELVAGLRALHASVTAPDAEVPGGRSRFGGFTAVRFDASGFFRVERNGARSWLVDPDGCAFFSLGVDCVGPSSGGPVGGMEDLFEWLPEPDGTFAAALGGRRDVSFVTVNLIRAFGADWRERWAELAAGLLRRYAFNTVGNWSDRRFARESKIPWVLPLGGFPSTRTRVYRDFPDVFADEYAAASRRFAEQMEACRDDPFLIGYFLRNEPVWAFGANNLAAEMLATATRSATRDELVRWLRARYEDDVASLRAAWQIDIASFDALAEQPLPDVAGGSKRARADLWAFSERMVDRYLRLPSEALREVAPHHLNLGIRYAWISSELCYVAAGELFDVFSLNSYTERPNAEQIAEVTARTGLPVLIGEFHHGAVDRGLPSTGIRGVRTQADRGAAYREYVEHGAAIPSLVGLHYFQWNDQPVLGRFDGENYNIGFVDVCHRPYADFVDAVTATNSDLLDVLTGQRSPTTVRPQTMRAIYF